MRTQLRCQSCNPFPDGKRKQIRQQILHKPACLRVKFTNSQACALRAIEFTAGHARQNKKRRHWINDGVVQPAKIRLP
jgi:hypothetical protein